MKLLAKFSKIQYNKDEIWNFSLLKGKFILYRNLGEKIVFKENGIARV
jgi:hypothetical protein